MASYRRSFAHEVVSVILFIKSSVHGITTIGTCSQLFQQIEN